LLLLLTVVVVNFFLFLFPYFLPSFLPSFAALRFFFLFGASL
jgi:hypothetical protein